MKFVGLLALLTLLEGVSADDNFYNDDYYYGSSSVCLRFVVVCGDAQVRSKGKSGAKAMGKRKMGSAKAKRAKMKMGSMAKSGKGMQMMDVDNGCERVCVEFGAATVSPQDPGVAPLVEGESSSVQPSTAAHSHEHSALDGRVGTQVGPSGNMHEHVSPGSPLSSTSATVTGNPIFGGSTFSGTSSSAIADHCHGLDSHDHSSATTGTRDFGTIVVDGQEFLLEPIPSSSAAVNFDDYYLDDDFESSVTSGMANSGSVRDAVSAETDDVSAVPPIAAGKAVMSSTFGKSGRAGKSGKAGKSGNGGKNGGVGKSGNGAKSGKVGIRGKSGRIGKSGQGNTNAYDDYTYDAYTYDDYTYDDNTYDDYTYDDYTYDDYYYDNNFASGQGVVGGTDDDYYTDDSFCLRFAMVCSRSISNGALRDTQCSRVCVEFAVEEQVVGVPTPSPRSVGSTVGSGTTPAFHSHGSGVVSSHHGPSAVGQGSHTHTSHGTGSSTSYHSHTASDEFHSHLGGTDSQMHEVHSHDGSTFASATAHHRYHYHDESLVAKKGSMMTMKKRKSTAGAMKKHGVEASVPSPSKDGVVAAKASKKANKTKKKGAYGKSMMSSKVPKSKDGSKKSMKIKNAKETKGAKKTLYHDHSGVCSRYETVCSEPGNCVQICTEFDVVPGSPQGSLPTQEHAAFENHSHVLGDGESHVHGTTSGLYENYYHGLVGGGESSHRHGTTSGAYENHFRTPTYNRENFLESHTHDHHQHTTTTSAPTDFAPPTSSPTMFVARTPIPTPPVTAPPTAADPNFGGLDAPSPSPSTAGKAKSMSSASSRRISDDYYVDDDAVCLHYEMMCSEGKAKGKGKGGKSMSSIASSSCQQTCVEYGPSPSGSMRK